MRFILFFNVVMLIFLAVDKLKNIFCVLLFPFGCLIAFFFYYSTA